MHASQQHSSDGIASRLLSSASEATATFESLPYEIIAHIFVLGCPFPHVGGDTFPFVTPNIREEPLAYQPLTASVCRQWRQVALGTPKLWSSIFVNLSFVYHRPGISTPEILHLLEKRSAATDLFLYIMASKAYGVTKDPTPDIVPVISRLLPRVYMLALDFHNADQLGALLFPLVNVPTLRHFRIHQFSIYDRPPARRHIFESAIHLDSFHLYPMSNMSPLDEETCLRHVSTPSLTYLPLARRLGPGTATALSIIEASSTLRNLHILYDCISPGASRGFVVNHPTLSTLKLTSREQHPTLACLGSLPELTHLTFIREKCAEWLSGAAPFPGPLIRVIGQMPRLRTLAVRAVCAGPANNTWDYVRHVTQLVLNSPGLVALELWNENAREVVTLLAERSADKANEVPNASLRLIRVVFSHPHSLNIFVPETMGACTSLVLSRPELRIEWYIQQPFFSETEDAVKVMKSFPQYLFLSLDSPRQNLEDLELDDQGVLSDGRTSFYSAADAMRDVGKLVAGALLRVARGIED